MLNFNATVKELFAGKMISGKDGVLASLDKQLIETILEAKLESHIADEVFKGYPNWSSHSRN